MREDLTLSVADLQQTPLALFSYCENAMATKPSAETPYARRWKEDTAKSYHSIMKKMQACYFDGLGLCFGDLEFEHLAEAVTAYEKNSRSQSFSDSSKEKLKTVLKSLTAFVHEKLPDYIDPCWGSSWSYVPLDLPKADRRKSRKSKESRENKENREKLRQLREQEIDEIVRLPRSLQIVEESKFAHALQARLLRQDGIAMGGLLMLYLGLRPSECCGLTWEAIQPLSRDGTVRALYVYRALDIRDRAKSSLKTKNAYRVLPIPDELDTLLKKRLLYVKEQLPELHAQQLSTLPIVNSTDSFAEHCPRRRFSDTIKNLLREIRANEKSLAYAAHLLEINGKTVREESPTTYLLRRHFATTMASICLMDDDELQYLMGHDIRDANIRHADLLDVDRLIKMYGKLNRRHIFTEPETADRICGPDCLNDIPACELLFDADTFASGGKVVLDVWASCPADALTLYAKPADPSAGAMAGFTVDYRPVPDAAPPVIRFDSTYHKVLGQALQRSEARSKDRDEVQQK